jgi:deoxyadenosine/deoxycytidine kinase
MLNPYLVTRYLAALRFSSNTPVRNGTLRLCRLTPSHGASKAVPSAISIAGPPGVGKTSIARALGPLVGGGRVYLEHFEDNPFLDRLDRPSARFDASASQAWFLDSIARFIRVGEGPLLIFDQDPTAIALVYGALLNERGALPPARFEEHLGALLDLEINAADRLNGRLVVLLDASPSILAERCANKLGM